VKTSDVTITPDIHCKVWFESSLENFLGIFGPKRDEIRGEWNVIRSSIIGTAHSILFG
jgi:hypothetical protein